MQTTLRPDRPTGVDETENLVGFLEFLRATLMMKCDGLTPQQLGSAAVEPSDLSLHGMIRHLTMVELGWFARVIGGEEIGHPYVVDGTETSFSDVDPDRYDEDLARYREAVERARAVTAAYPMDHVGPGSPYTLRWVVVHMIEEYARHCGHADLIRERIDGVTGE